MRYDLSFRKLENRLKKAEELTCSTRRMEDIPDYFFTPIGPTGMMRGIEAIGPFSKEKKRLIELLNCRTMDEVKEAGFTLEEVKDLYYDMEAQRCVAFAAVARLDDPIPEDRGINLAGTKGVCAGKRRLL